MDFKAFITSIEPHGVMLEDIEVNFERSLENEN